MGGHADLSLQQAQRICVAAQGLTTKRRDTKSSVAELTEVYGRIGQTQVDSVNVVCRAHYQPLFARIGNYDRQDLDALVAQPASGVTEYWGHEASFVQSDYVMDLARWRDGHWADRSQRFNATQRSLTQDVLQYLREHPGSSARQLSQALGVPGKQEATGWGWNWNDTKLVTEALFGQAEILSLGRNQHFERRFALADQVLSAQHRTVQGDRVDSLGRLVLAAARSLGLATDRSLAEYYRLPLREVRTVLRELVDAGQLEKVQVSGQPVEYYLWPDTPIPSRISQTVRILSPFDSMVFDRRRLAELFDFHYRLEIYVPQAKRRYGYYVFPILLGHRFIGRVDLKAERKTGELRVQALYFESAPSQDWLERSNNELWRMANWLGLDTVNVGTERVLCNPWALAANAKPSSEMSK